MKDLEIGHTIAGRYKLIKKLGEGGIGNVYLAEDQHIRRRVAIKSIRQELINDTKIHKRIARECDLHATLGAHPNIVILHDKLEWNGNIFLVMEYVEGITLSRMTAGNQQSDICLPVEESISILCDVLAALTHIHEHNIIHRDIKPSNIMLTPKDGGGYLAKLMDFGVADIEHVDEALTLLAPVDEGGPGTPAYMAPERIDSATYGQQGPATDLYSVGIILYELIANKPPFVGSITEIFTAQLTREPDIEKLLPQISPQLGDVIQRALQKKSTDRIGQAKEFAALLRGANTAAAEESTFENAPTLLATASFAKSALKARDRVVSSASMEKAVGNGGKKKMLFVTVMGIVVLALASGYWWLKDTPETVVSTEKIQKNNVEEKIGDELPATSKTRPLPTVTAVQTSPSVSSSEETVGSVTPSITPPAAVPQPVSLTDQVGPTQKTAPVPTVDPKAGILPPPTTMNPLSSIDPTFDATHLGPHEGGKTAGQTSSAQTMLEKQRKKTLKLHETRTSSQRVKKTTPLNQPNTTSRKKPKRVTVAPVRRPVKSSQPSFQAVKPDRVGSKGPKSALEERPGKWKVTEKWSEKVD